MTTEITDYSITTYVNTKCNKITMEIFVDSKDNPHEVVGKIKDALKSTGDFVRCTQCIFFAPNHYGENKYHTGLCEKKLVRVEDSGCYSGVMR